MNVLVTGGAGFIGRWVVKKLLSENVNVWVLDNLSNGSEQNLVEFDQINNYQGLTIGDISDISCVERVFKTQFDVCIHTAAQINVQESLDNPHKSFRVNMVGTYNVLSCALKSKTKVILIGTCMVYDMATSDGISELSSVKPASPYSGSKLAAEELALSYYYGFGLPVTVLRPFNTYGPFQKTNMEGGVVSIFVQNHIAGENLKVFGDGTQTRDLLYVEDCAEFIVRAAFSENSAGEVINAGTGRDISINDLALLICRDLNRIEHVKHHHPQSEIQKLLGSFSKAQKLLGWKPKTPLEEGIAKTEQWIKTDYS
ncbi:MAG: NAD(P)-dependent oxidoreductase [Chloroflexi bacterium]|jgi:UDP-glucose 4-epimerase|nr:NAD(P)-dependent oxidoreductase [Chloroflexota bacterium]